MKKFFIALFIPCLFFFLLVGTAAAQKKVESTTLPSNSIHSGDYFAANEKVVVSGTVEGDVYAAGGLVRIDGTVNGDILAAGGDLLISGVVNQDVRVAGGNITFSGAQIEGNVTILGGQVTLDKATQINGNLTIAGGNLQVLSPVVGGLSVAGGNVEIGSSIGKNVQAAVGEISLLNGSSVAGDFSYISDSQVSISEGATISGEVRRTTPPRNQDAENAGKALAAGVAGFAILLKLADVIMLLLLGFLFIFLLPVYTLRVTDIVRKKFGTVLLLGLLYVIIMPVISALIMLSVIGIPLGMFMLVIYAATLWFAKIIGIIAFSNILFNNKKVRKNPYGVYAIGVLIYLVLSFVPVISFFIDILLVLTGTGSFVITKKEYYIELRRKKAI